MEFTKMHGLGNDFLIFEDDDTDRDWNALARKLCPRGLAVGADGILVVCPSEVADLKMRIINADGSEAEMCGNGIRCFAKYVYEKGIACKTNLSVETLAGVMRPRLYVQDGIVTGVRVDMGKPSFERADIPMKGEGSPFDVSIVAAGQSVKVSSVLMGVPHTIVLVDDTDKIDFEALGPAIERHEMFPRKTNVDFAQILDRQNVKLRVWERGAGPTLACGTGSSGTVALLYKKGLVDAKCTVHLFAGELSIECLDDGRVMMTGPAACVYRGTLCV